MPDTPQTPSARRAAPVDGSLVIPDLDGFTLEGVFERACECLRVGEFEDSEVGFRWMHLALLRAAEATRLAAIGHDRNDPIEWSKP
jgi:hypothetical protein